MHFSTMLASFAHGNVWSNPPILNLNTPHHPSPYVLTVPGPSVMLASIEDVDACPQCGTEYNVTTHRKVNEPCGHSKCRNCVIMSDDWCVQCDLSNGHEDEENFNVYPIPNYGTAGASLLSPDFLNSNNSSPVLNYGSTESYHETPMNFDIPDSKPNLLWQDAIDQATDNTNTNQCNDNDVKNFSSGIVKKRKKRRRINVAIPEPIPLEEPPEFSKSADMQIENDIVDDNQRTEPQSNENSQNVQIENNEETQHEEPNGDDLSGNKYKMKKKSHRVTIPAHITVLNGDKSTFQCNVCSKTFKTKSHIQYHQYCPTGGKDKPFQCEECGQGFIVKSHYDYHLRTHTGECPYSCPTCGKKFNQKSKVPRHMRSHTGERPYECEQCHHHFITAEALQRHIYVHTNERPYKCTYCTKSFKGATGLKKHVACHTGDRPFLCDFCSKGFAEKWTLSMHMKTHSDVRAFGCEKCDRAFFTCKDLRRHQLTHSGEKPFTCLECGAAFCRKDNLDRHARTTHGPPAVKGKTKKTNKISRPKQAESSVTNTKECVAPAPLSTPSPQTINKSRENTTQDLKVPPKKRRSMMVNFDHDLPSDVATPDTTYNQQQSSSVIENNLK